MKWNSPKPYVQDPLPAFEDPPNLVLPIGACTRAAHLVGDYLKAAVGLTSEDYTDIIHAQTTLSHGASRLQGVESRIATRKDKGAD